MLGSQPVPSSPFVREARGPVWRHSMLGMVVSEAKRLACWHSRDSWQSDSEKERPLASTANIVQWSNTILEDQCKMSSSFLSQSTYWQIFKTIIWWTLQGFQKSGSACLSKCGAKLCTNTETDSQTDRWNEKGKGSRGNPEIWMCLDCGKWEPALSQCTPCSCSQSAGWSRGQTHCLHRGGGKVSMEETRRHSPLSLPCDVLSQQVPHSVYSSPPCVGLCTHHSSPASDIIIVLLLYLCSWGFASKLYSNISSSVFGRGWVIKLP